MNSINELQMFLAFKAGMFPLEIKAHSTDSSKKYASFGDKDGKFYIMEITTASNGDTSYRYKIYSTATGYEAAWAIRESLTYNYPWEAIV